MFYKFLEVIYNEIYNEYIKIIDDVQRKILKGGFQMRKRNEAVRMAMRIHDVKQWELAEALGMAEATLSRKLRTDLSPELQNAMIDLIKKIAAKEVE